MTNTDASVENNPLGLPEMYPVEEQEIRQKALEEAASTSRKAMEKVAEIRIRGLREKPEPVRDKPYWWENEMTPMTGSVRDGR